MKDIIIKKYPHILHGGDYNPEQWLDYPDVLSEDMRLLKIANCNELTVGIFSWSTLEKSEGEFDFSFLDKAIDDIYNAGGRVILATPSGAKPIWLATKYPETLRVDENGVRYKFGARHNHCYSSPIYREKIAVINQKLAQRYKNHPAVIAWHISNEFSGECYCENCVKGFREWLKAKYGTIDKLNHDWWNTFWSHSYDDWEQIDPPGPLTDHYVHARDLDWKRYVTYKTTDFMKHEISVIRKITPDIPITTNLMGFYNGLDYRVLSKEIDFVSWDCYPPWSNNPSRDLHEARFTAMTHDLMRSLKHRPFLVMESVPNVTSWFEYNKLKRPKVHELTSLQAVAHGSDSVLYFQWRKSRGAVEKFHGAVVDHVGNENTRVFKDVSALGERLKGLDEIVGTTTKAKAAIVFDWDNRWAIDMAKGFATNNKKYIDTVEQYYYSLWKRGIDTDIVSRTEDLSKYSLVIAPMQYIVCKEAEQNFADYVKNGGTLLCTYMTGMVDENDLCHLGGFPCGELKNVFGIWNEEIDTLYPEDSNTIKLYDEKEFKAIDYCELIHTRGAKVLGVYGEDFYKGMPGFTENSYGKGKAYYVAFRDNGDFTDYIVEKLLNETSISSAFDGELPKDVTAHSRSDDKNTYVFLENYSHNDVLLKTSLNWENIEIKALLDSKIELPAQTTLILKQM